MLQLTRGHAAMVIANFVGLLLLVGLAYLGWLVVQGVKDMVKQETETKGDRRVLYSDGLLLLFAAWAYR